MCMEKPILVKKKFINGLNYLKKVELVFKMKSSQVGSQW